jgi:hypothetical protein
MRLRQPLSDVLRHAISEYSFYFSSLDSLTQLVQGADVQLFVDSHDAFGIKPWMCAKLC